MQQVRGAAKLLCGRLTNQAGVAESAYCFLQNPWRERPFGRVGGRM